MQESIDTQDQNQSNGMALAAMITGIIGLILSVIPVIGLLSWIICPIAAILGFLSMGKPTGRGMAITGIVTGILGVLICIAWATLFAAVGSAVGAAAEDSGLNTEAILEEISAVPATQYAWRA